MTLTTAEKTKFSFNSFQRIADFVEHKRRAAGVQNEAVPMDAGVAERFLLKKRNGWKLADSR